MRLECECSTDFLPHSLRAHGQQLISRLWDSLNSKDQVALNAALKQTEGLNKQLITALLGSDYIVESCCRDSSLLFSWLLSDVPFAPLTPVKIIDAVNTTCSDEFSPEEFSRVLRNLRRRFMVGIYWRDLNRLADFNETRLQPLPRCVYNRRWILILKTVLKNMACLLVKVQVWRSPCWLLVWANSAGAS